MQALLLLTNRLMRQKKKAGSLAFFYPLSSLKLVLIFWLFICLFGCEPALEHFPEQQLMDEAQQGNAAAAVILAKKREKQGDSQAALNWYQKAVDAGFSNELTALISLKQKQDGFLAAASYLEHYLQQKQSLNAAEADLAADFGLWQYVHNSVQSPIPYSHIAPTYASR